MEWFFGAAALPLIACGLMCLGGMALAAVGLRKAKRAPDDIEVAAGTASEVDDAHQVR